MDELVKLSKPQLPTNWQYETSIKFVSETIFKWKNLTVDVAQELWIAREVLSKVGRNWNESSDNKTWAEYCEEIGSSKQVVNRWLKRWFETVHVSNNSGENEWYTPLYIIELARNTMGSIDLDPATTLLANETVQAKQIFTDADDGLIKKWFGNVWLNPPYSQPLISEFSNKLITELKNIQQACVLVNNATETTWLQNMLRECNSVCFIKGRIKFIDKEGNPSGAPLQGQTILYFGNNSKLFYSNFKDIGICLTKTEEK